VKGSNGSLMGTLKLICDKVVGSKEQKGDAEAIVRASKGNLIWVAGNYRVSTTPNIYLIFHNDLYHVAWCIRLLRRNNS
jgi:hypothetical protein